MGLYDKKRSLSRGELKGTLRKHPGQIPGTGGKKYSQGERERLVRSTFGPKYGSQISKGDYRRAIRELRSARNATKDKGARRKIAEQIRYLEELGGKKV